VLDIYLDDFVAAFDQPNNPGIVVVDTSLKIT
jgi:hypothetical protein